MIEVRLPDLGEGITSVEISDVLVTQGDSIKLDDPIIVVETEKASMEIPTIEGGVIESVQVEKGGTLSPGDVIIRIEVEGQTKSPIKENDNEAEIVESVQDEISKAPTPKQS